MKVVMLTCQYESFTMKDGETVDDMFGRMEILLSEFEALGKIFTKVQISLKLMDNMSKV